MTHDDNSMQRRDFLRRVAGGLALGCLPGMAAAAAETSSSLETATTSTQTATATTAKLKRAADRVLLGPRKISASRLAMGTGTVGVRHGSNQTRKLGLKGLADLLRAGYEQGVTFWDSADQYGSHEYIKEALKAVPRDKVVIMTKTRASNEKQMREDLDRFRRELGTDYIDILLLHCMTDTDWNVKRRGAMDVLSEAREKSIVRTHGVSCHTLGALQTAAREPWVELDFARINPAEKHMDADKETVVAVMRQMKAAGKAVVGMKIIGEGLLRDRIDESLRYVLGLDCVDAFCIGFENRAELDDMIARIPKAST